MGFLPTPIPAVQTTGGVARNENVYDSELWNSGVNLLGTSIATFANLGQFQTITAPVIAKQENRDTNLSSGGTGGGLPQGNQMFAYYWSNEIHFMDAILSLAANVGVFEQANRLRRCSAAFLKINQVNQYITARLIDLVAFEDAQFIQTTHGGSTVMAPAVGDRKGKSLMSTQRYLHQVKDKSGAQVQKTVPVRNSPYILQAQQAFRIIVQTPVTSTPSAVPLLLTVPAACVMKLWGVLVRGMT